MNEKSQTLVFPWLGTTDANVDIDLTLPYAYTLEYASAVASNDSDATWTIGSSSEADYYLASETVGDSGTPAENGRGDWASTITTDFPHISADTRVVIAVDYDGSSGTAAQNLIIVLKILID